MAIPNGMDFSPIFFIFLFSPLNSSKLLKKSFKKTLVGMPHV